MGIIVVEHNDINVKIVKQYLFNLRMRMVLARFQRKTIKFSKSWERLEYSVNLVINRYNRQLI